MKDFLDIMNNTGMVNSILGRIINSELEKERKNNHDIINDWVSINVVSEFIEDFKESGLFKNKKLDLFKNKFGFNDEEWLMIELNGFVKDVSSFYSQKEDGGEKTYYSGDPEFHRKVLVNIAKENNLRLE